MLDDPYTMEAVLCEDDGIVRRGAMHRGTDYHCTGHAHWQGEHIRCLSPYHAQPTPGFAVTTAVSVLDEIRAWQQRLRESRRLVVCAPGREEGLKRALSADGTNWDVDVQASPFVQGTEVYVIGRLGGF